MSNDYVTNILVDQRLRELRHENELDRLAREARQGRPRRRWWERLMLFRTGSGSTRPATGRGSHQHAATAGANSPC